MTSSQEPPVPDGSAATTVRTRRRSNNPPPADRRRAAYVARQCHRCGVDVERRVTDTRQFVYCSLDCYHKMPFKGKGRPVTSKIGDLKSDGSGYMWVYIGPNPGGKYAKGWLPEHVAVMEQMLGRKLIDGENVHHKNGEKGDNRPSNLELWSTHQPKGQRIPDKVSYAREILGLYGDDGERARYPVVVTPLPDVSDEVRALLTPSVVPRQGGFRP